MLSVICCFFVAFCTVDARRIVDLTHTLDHDAPKYPLDMFGAPDFVYFNTTTLIERYIGDMWVSFKTAEYFEHQGTHIDAPAHIGKGRQSLEQISTDGFYKLSRLYKIFFKAHEREHGTIPPKAIVHMNSGWGQKYPNVRLVFATENVTDPSTFHYPGWSLQACEMLFQQRQINVLGVDTPSTDPAQPLELPCHIYLQNNNVPLLEYVANLDSIPVRNTTMMLGVMKVRSGSGGPTRILAIIDDDEDDVSGSTGKSSPLVALVFTLLYICQLK